MKNILFILSSFLFLGFTTEVFSQKAKIELKEKSLIVNLSAVSSDEVFTDAGNFKFSEIKGIVFEKYEASYQSVYSKLQIRVPIKFGDGSPLDISTAAEFTEDTRGQTAISINEPISLKEFTADSTIYPEYHLVKGSKSAFTGMALSFLGIVLVGVGSASGDGSVVIAGAVAGITGIGFTLDAWSSIGRAGKAMKAERERNKNKK